jgi:hypothetical protein
MSREGKEFRRSALLGFRFLFTANTGAVVMVWYRHLHMSS